MTRLLPRLMAIIAMTIATTIATPALAHAGHDPGSGASGLAAGMLHPLTGWDHVAAMLLIGAWSASLSRRGPAIMLPAFLVAMFAGFGSALLQATAIEAAVTASVAIAAAAVIARWRAPLPVATALAALFGFAHGQAHGIDLAQPASFMPFALGILLASGGLLMAGTLVVRPVGRRVPA